MVYLTRRERFSAAHRMHTPGWTDEQNYEYFGLCANPHWHGHNYELFVTVKYDNHVDPSFFVNIKHLSSVIKTCVIDKIDHKNLNLEVDFMKGKLTSTENLAIGIFNQLVEPVKKIGVILHGVKVTQTENNIVEYFG